MMVRSCRCPRQQEVQTISQLVGGGGGVSYMWSTKHIVALPGLGMSLAISLFVLQRLEVVYISSTSTTIVQNKEL